MLNRLKGRDSKNVGTYVKAVLVEAPAKCKDPKREIKKITSVLTEAMVDRAIPE